MYATIYGETFQSQFDSFVSALTTQGVLSGVAHAAAYALALQGTGVQLSPEHLFSISLAHSSIHPEADDRNYDAEFEAAQEYQLAHYGY
jgi:Pyruvate/2-oxoacid:ferredoxin oxidoreductase gamma subunit